MASVRGRLEQENVLCNARGEAGGVGLCSYLLECVYGLMLAPQGNLSKSMGFEPILIVQNKRYLEAAE